MPRHVPSWNLRERFILCSIVAIFGDDQDRGTPSKWQNARPDPSDAPYMIPLLQYLGRARGILIWLVCMEAFAACIKVRSSDTVFRHPKATVDIKQLVAVENVMSRLNSPRRLDVLAPATSEELEPLRTAIRRICNTENPVTLLIATAEGRQLTHWDPRHRQIRTVAGVPGTGDFILRVDSDLGVQQRGMLELAIEGHAFWWESRLRRVSYLGREIQD